MRDRWLTLAALTAVAVTTVATVARAGSSTEQLVLAPNAPGVAAGAAIAGDTVSVSVHGVRPGVVVRAFVDRLACGSDYETASVGRGTASASGRVSWQASLPAAARDGRHVLALSARGRTVACAPIPPPRPTAADGSQHSRIWTFARHFVD